MNARKWLREMLLTCLVLLTTTSCATAGGLQGSAQTSFEQWAQRKGTPYRNVRYETVKNDGTFATVRVTADLRRSAEANWVEMGAVVDCQNVGGSWACDQYFSFEETAEIATATAQAKDRRESINQGSQLVEIDCDAPVETSSLEEGGPFLEAECKIHNADSREHTYVVHLALPVTYSGCEKGGARQKMVWESWEYPTVGANSTTDLEGDVTRDDVSYWSHRKMLYCPFGSSVCCKSFELGELEISLEVRR